MHPPRLQIPDSVDQVVSGTFEARLRSCYPRLRKRARRMTGTEQDADDLVQETVLAALLGSRSFDATRDLFPWLVGTMKHLLARRLRAEARCAKADAALDVRSDRPDEPTKLAEQRELWRRTRAAIADLPGSYSEVASLHLLHDMSPREVARTLGRPRATIRVRIHRALHLLRMRLANGLGLGALWALLSGEAKAQARRGAAITACVVALAVLVVCNRFASRGELEASAEDVLVARAEARHERPPTDSRIEPAAARVAVVPPAAPARLAVKIVDAHGAGVPGVGLRVVPESGREELLHEQCAVTGPDGTVHLACDAGIPFTLISDRGPRASIAPSQVQCTLMVADASPVRGDVRDEFGVPVPRARIWLGEGDESGERGQEVAIADERGHFELTAVPARRRIAARADDRARSNSVVLSASVLASAVTLVMPRAAGRVRGVVRGDDGAPVSGAVVVLGESEQTSGLRLAGDFYAERPPAYWLRTDADGAFLSPGLEPGSHPVVVRAAGRAPFATTIEVHAGAISVVKARLEPGLHLRGRVTDPEGRPLANAMVEHDVPSVFEQCGIRSASDGTFEFECVPAGVRSVFARALGHVRCDVVLAPEHRAGGTIELVAPRLESVRGTILDESGRPLSGIEVATEARLASARSCDIPFAVTDASGCFEVPLVLREKPELRIRGSDEPVWQRPAGQVSRLPDGSLRIVRPRTALPTARVSGCVRTAAGEPMCGARVALLHEGDSEPTPIATTDASGTFAAGRLPEGVVRLLVESARADQASFTAGTWTLLRGRETPVFATAPPSGRVHVALSRSDGQPVRDLRATVFRDGSTRPWAEWSERDAVRELVPGRYHLRVLGNDFRARCDDVFTVREGVTTELAFELEPAVRLKVVIAGADAGDLAPATSGTVSIERDDGNGLAVIGVPVPKTVAWHLVWAPKGRIHAVLRTNDGRVSRRSFLIEDLAPRSEPLELRFD